MDFVILKVNGKDLSNATHEETVDSLNAAQEPIVVEVERRSSNTRITNTQNSRLEKLSLSSVATQTECSISSDAANSKIFIVPAPPPITSSCEEVLAMSASSSESTLDDGAYEVEYHKVILRRDCNSDRIGLTLSYEKAEDEDMSNIYIEKVEANSVASRNGTIQKGDQIIQVNNQNVRNRADAIKIFRESGANIQLLICRLAHPDQMDDGFLEECCSNIEEDHVYEYVYTQDIRGMPLDVVEERSEYEDESNLTDTATLPSQKEKEGKDSGVGQDSAGSSEQECESSHYETISPSKELDLPAGIEKDLKFRQLLEVKCAELSLDSVDHLCTKLNQLQTDSSNRVVPKMGTKIMSHQTGSEQSGMVTQAEMNDTAYNTAESAPTTLELTKNLTGSSFSLSPSKKQSRRLLEKKRRQIDSPNSSPLTSTTDITYTTEDKLAETMAQQQHILLQQSKNSTLTKDNQEVTEDAGTFTENSHMEWVVKRRSDGSRYITRRPIRTKILKERKKKLENERCGMTTDDDTMSELKVGRHWTRDERRAHLQKAREHQQRKAIMQQRVEMARKQAREGQNHIIAMSHKKLHKHTMKDVDFTTVQELLAHQGKIPISPSNLVSVTTV
ncbi:PDZ domain-containing RING finger protein 4-like [Watersipora subatra]|uniref:PDZ domain-containing RING finger protein 4-like n=1 Tax=Watersipora subatra TaxID=2589382 RepID=UPI00355C571E